MTSAKSTVMTNVSVEGQKHPKLGAVPTGSIEAQPGSRGESSSNPRGSNNDVGNDDEYFN